MTFEHDVLMLDACCVMTLYASGRMDDVLRSIPPSVTVAAYVYEEEALFIYAGPEDDVRREREPITLEPLVEAGLLAIVSLESADEILAYVNLSSRLDDGEAATIAIASTRNWMVATDDKKAIGVLETYERLQVVTTPDLLKHWADTTKASSEAIAEVLRAVQGRSVYKPGKRHSLFAWWQHHAS